VLLVICESELREECGKFIVPIDLKCDANLLMRLKPISAFLRMGRPGRIYISLSSRAGVLEKVRVGGEAVVVGEGTVLE
jgi:hypothetical protein